MTRAVALAATVAVACGVASSVQPHGGDAKTEPERTCDPRLAAGAIEITEVLANPSGDDDGYEYIEIHNASGDVLPLAGLSLAYSRLDGGGAAAHVLGPLDAEPGAYLVLGGVLDGLRPAHVSYGYGAAFELRNEGAALALRCREETIDAMVYARARAGVAFERDPETGGWCEARALFAPMQRGTPGRAGDRCGP